MVIGAFPYIGSAPRSPRRPRRASPATHTCPKRHSHRVYRGTRAEGRRLSHPLPPSPWRTAGPRTVQRDQTTTVKASIARSCLAPGRRLKERPNPETTPSPHPPSPWRTAGPRTVQRDQTTTVKASIARSCLAPGRRFKERLNPETTPWLTPPSPWRTAGPRTVQRDQTTNVKTSIARSRLAPGRRLKERPNPETTPSPHPRRPGERQGLLTSATRPKAHRLDHPSRGPALRQDNGGDGGAVTPEAWRTATPASPPRNAPGLPGTAIPPPRAPRSPDPRSLVPRYQAGPGHGWRGRSRSGRPGGRR